MIYKIKNTQSAAPLFADWEETIIWSCLEGVMGELYADDVGHPESAMAVLGDFCFLGGKASEELLRYNPSQWNRDVMIMIPQSEEWAEMIERIYKGNAHKVERYAIKKEKAVFNMEKLHKIVEAIPENCTLQFVDEELYHRCKEEDWSKDLVSQFPTYEEYKKMGMGVVLLVDNLLAAGASSYSVYSQGIEIEIDTKEEYRRRGYATICGAKLILECLRRGLYPSWDAQNKNSVALAEKLGYHYSHTYTAYEVSMRYKIRYISNTEYAVLEDFLYEAIYIPQGIEAPPKSIINRPGLQVYIENFGQQESDICFVAEVQNNIIGAVWVRIMDDYGHVEDGVPSFAISLYKEYRGLGIGTAMMKRMLEELRERGYQKASLAVQKANYAVKMYKNVGFKIIDENEEEYIMVCNLHERRMILSGTGGSRI